MAANSSEVVFDLRGQTDFSERGKTFWNASELELKFSFEREWIKAVRRAKRRPNYGLGKMNSGLEGSALDSIHQNHLGREGLRWNDGQLMTCYTK